MPSSRCEWAHVVVRGAPEGGGGGAAAWGGGVGARALPHRAATGLTPSAAPSPSSQVDPSKNRFLGCSTVSWLVVPGGLGFLMLSRPWNRASSRVLSTIWSVRRGAPRWFSPIWGMFLRPPKSQYPCSWLFSPRKFHKCQGSEGSPLWFSFWRYPVLISCRILNYLSQLNWMRSVSLISIGSSCRKKNIYRCSWAIKSFL